jgi:hypothetical protein
VDYNTIRRCDTTSFMSSANARKARRVRPLKRPLPHRLRDHHLCFTDRAFVTVFNLLSTKSIFGEAIKIKASKKVAFRATKELKLAI